MVINEEMLEIEKGNKNKWFSVELVIHLTMKSMLRFDW